MQEVRRSDTKQDMLRALFIHIMVFGEPGRPFHPLFCPPPSCLPQQRPNHSLPPPALSLDRHPHTSPPAHLLPSRLALHPLTCFPPSRLVPAVPCHWRPTRSPVPSTHPHVPVGQPHMHLHHATTLPPALYVHPPSQFGQPIHVFTCKLAICSLHTEEIKVRTNSRLTLTMAPCTAPIWTSPSLCSSHLSPIHHGPCAMPSALPSCFPPPCCLAPVKATLRWGHSYTKIL